MKDFRPLMAETAKKIADCICDDHLRVPVSDDFRSQIQLAILVRLGDVQKELRRLDGERRFKDVPFMGPADLTAPALENVLYRALKSGAVNWLSDRDWNQLEEAGWKVHWISKDPDYQKLHEEGKVLIVEGRLHGSLANEAEKCFSSVGEAMREFQKVTGLSVTEEGCDHCGPPHIFEWKDKRASGKECQEYLD